MTRAILVLLCLGLLVSAGVAFGSRLSFEEHAAVQESLSRVHPRTRASWLKERGVDDPYYTAVRMPDSGQGLREVGRWSYGPSYDVDGRVTPNETLVALARGSGVSLLRFSRLDSLTIELLSDINAEGLMCRVKVVDTLLYVGSRKGLEVYNIADEQNPVRLSWVPIPLNDFALQDSLVYTISGDDSFRIYNVSSPASPVLRGACVDSGDLVSVAGNAAFVGGRWGLYIIDVANPTNPHRIGSWGSAIEQVEARGHLCYVTTFNPNVPGEITFHVLDVAVPSLPYQIGSLDSAGGRDVCLIDTLAFGAGEEDFDQITVLSVADSTRPRLLGSAGRPGWGYGVWASGPAQSAFVGSHWTGLQIYDIRNSSLPVRDTFLLDADQALDVYIDGDRAYVADCMAGLKILDVSDPARPTTLGSYDTAGQMPSMASAVARDSFAFVDWFWFRVVDVSDPAHPKAAGQLDPFAPPEDMVLRDSFVYCAEINRFQIVNVARPREPVLVGSCVAGDLTRAGLVVRDTLAYFIGPFEGLEVFSVENPTAPYLLNTVAEIRAAGCDVIDTLLYVGDYDDSLHIWSFADPLAPYQLSSVFAVRSGYGVAVLGRYAYVGCDSRVRVFDVLDARNPVEVGSCATPYEIRRVEAGNGYVYACCWEAGVSIFDTFQSGVESRASPSFKSSELVVGSPVAGDAVSLELRAKPGSAVRVTIIDAVGRVLLRNRPVVVPGSGIYRHQMNVGSLPAGVYIINVRVGLETRLTRFVKLRRR
jgi:hypothetical protein